MTNLTEQDLKRIEAIEAYLKNLSTILPIITNCKKEFIPYQPIDTTEGEPIEKQQRWQPSKGQLYYYVNFTQKVKIGSFTWVSDEIDVDLYELGNCFKTKEAAQKAAEAIKQYLSTNKF